MSHFDKLLNVPPAYNACDLHLFDIHLADLPDLLPLNMPIPHSELLAAITAVKSNKASDLYGMRSEFIIDAAAELTSSITTVFNVPCRSTFPSAQSIGRLCPLFKSGDEHSPDNYRGITVGTVPFQALCHCTGAQNQQFVALLSVRMMSARTIQ